MNINELSIKELTEVAKAMSEGDFYRELNTKLEGELGHLAEYLSKTMKKLQFIESPIMQEKNKIPDASNQLSDVTKAMEEATHKIMALTEKILDGQDTISEHLQNLKKAIKSKKDEKKAMSFLNSIEEINGNNKNDLVTLLTSLSFQDLTGQKIKKIISLVKDIESKISELLSSFNLEKKEKKKEIITELNDPSKSLDLKQDIVDEILEKLL